MLKSESGFTLIEALVVLSVSMILLISITPIIQFLHQFFQQNTYKSVETMIFMNQLENDVKESTSFLAHSNGLTLTKSDDRIVTYLMTNHHTVQRYSNNGGYVPMLYSVKSFGCNRDIDILECRVELENGHERSNRMIPMYGVRDGRH